MRLARHAFAALASLLLAAPSFAQSAVTSEAVGSFHGSVQLVPEVGPSRPQPGAPSAVTVVYENTTSATLAGVSSTDLTSVWGDRLFMTGGGLLSSHSFTIFNSGSSGGGSLLSATVLVEFFDDATTTFIGGYSGTVTFGAGLLPNQFSIITASALDGLGLVLPANVIVLQTVTAFTGTANRLGVVSMNPVNVGSSPTTMYIDSATLSGGVPGFYNLANPANPGNLVGIAQPPVGTQSSSWGKLKQLYR